VGIEEDWKVDALVLLSADVVVERIPVEEFLPYLLLENAIDRGVPQPFAPEDPVEEGVTEVFDLQATVADETADHEIGHVERRIRDRFDDPFRVEREPGPEPDPAPGRWAVSEPIEDRGQLLAVLRWPGGDPAREPLRFGLPLGVRVVKEP